MEILDSEQQIQERMMKEQEFKWQIQTVYNTCIIGNIPTLEELSGKKFDKVIFDSDYV